MANNYSEYVVVYSTPNPTDLMNAEMLLRLNRMPYVLNCGIFWGLFPGFMGIEDFEIFVSGFNKKAAIRILSERRLEAFVEEGNFGDDLGKNKIIKR